MSWSPTAVGKHGADRVHKPGEFHSSNVLDRCGVYSM